MSGISPGDGAGDIPYVGLGISPGECAGDILFVGLGKTPVDGISGVLPGVGIVGDTPYVEPGGDPGVGSNGSGVSRGDPGIGSTVSGESTGPGAVLGVGPDPGSGVSCGDPGEGSNCSGVG